MNFFPLLFIIALLPFFIIFGWKILSSSLEVFRARSWSVTTGQILSSGVEMRRRRGGGRLRYSQCPVVVYQYTVGGQTYQGRRIHFGQEVGGAWWAGRTASRFPVGSNAPVYFHPQNPAEAVLLKKAPANLFLWLVIGFILLMLVLNFLFSFGLSSFLNGLFRFLPQ